VIENSGANLDHRGKKSKSKPLELWQAVQANAFRTFLKMRKDYYKAKVVNKGFQTLVVLR